jgi:murein DD-endopeptidase MepM/ murein hydrolase activator NlpD
VAVLCTLALTAGADLATTGAALGADGNPSMLGEAERRDQQQHRVDAALALDPATATTEQLIGALTLLDQDRQSELALGAEAERAQHDAERRLDEHLADLAEVQPEVTEVTNALKTHAVRLYLDPEGADGSIRLLKADTFDDAQQRRVFDDVLSAGSTTELIDRLRAVRPKRDEFQAQAVAARDEAAARKKEHEDRFAKVLSAQTQQGKLQTEWDRRTTGSPKGSDDLGDTSAIDRAIAEQRAKLPPAAPAPRSSNGKMIWPAIGPITDRYGYLSSRGRNHWGLDVGISTGTPVVAALGGKVVLAGWDSGGYGNLVAIDHAGGLQTRYAHNSKILVSVGQTVTQGQQISLSGSTGNSTGPHLHFEVYLNGAHVNPANYLP